jgi:hypothetical protein
MTIDKNVKKLEGTSDSLVMELPWLLPEANEENH